jgi:hypothetical protein
VLADLVLDEAVGVDPVGEAVQHQRPPGEVGEHHVGDRPVILDHVALGHRVVGVEQLVQVGQFDVVGCVSGHGYLVSLTTSAAGLS